MRCHLRPQPPCNPSHKKRHSRTTLVWCLFRSPIRIPRQPASQAQAALCSCELRKSPRQDEGYGSTFVRSSNPQAAPIKNPREPRPKAPFDIRAVKQQWGRLLARQKTYTGRYVQVWALESFHRRRPQQRLSDFITSEGTQNGQKDKRNRISSPTADAGAEPHHAFAPQHAARPPTVGVHGRTSFCPQQQINNAPNGHAAGVVERADRVCIKRAEQRQHHPPSAP